MKRLATITFSLVILSLLLPAASSGAQFRITKVYDGDTLKAEANGVIIYILLVGIDCPELSNKPDRPSQPFAEAAKEVVSAWVMDKKVEVKGYGRVPAPDDKIISVIYREGRNINLELVKHGLAEVYREHLPPDFDISPYVEAEKQARKEKRGIWALGQNYLSPARWRRMHLGE